MDEAIPSPPSPGEVLRGRLVERGWTQDDLARVIRRSRQQVNAVITGRSALTPEMAVALATAFGDEPSFWMGVHLTHQLALLPEGNAMEIRRAAKLYELGPVQEMEKRNWIRRTHNDSELEKELCRFFEVKDLGEPPSICAAARKADADKPLSASQRAWCFRAKGLAKGLMAARFDPAKLDQAQAALRQLAAFPAEIGKVPKVLADYGVRLVIVEHLPGDRIDGAAMWLDEASPVIALTVRHDRIDGFWFTLMHEFSHVRHGDALSVDSNLIGEAHTPSMVKDDCERRADSDAVAALVEPGELHSFTLRAGPMYSTTRIIQFAHRIKIHPGIIVGQLQHRGEVSYHSHRDLLVKVRDRITSTAMTDGWGHTIEIEGGEQ